MSLRPFDSFYATAVLHKGGEAQVEAQLPRPLSSKKLASISDDRYLSMLSLRIFRAGLKHSMVDAKWPAFEEVFFGFDPIRVAMLSDEELEGLMQDKRIIRHFGKIRAVRANAVWMLEVAAREGSFGRWIAGWPTEDIVGLWAQLKKQGSQLGGQSGARFLRMMGKDTFILTDDVVNVLKAEGIVDKMPTSQKALQVVQQAFNTWQEQSGRSLAEISRVLSYTVNVA